MALPKKDADTADWSDGKVVLVSQFSADWSSSPDLAPLASEGERATIYGLILVVG
jgi:hypothetical protein